MFFFSMNCLTSDSKDRHKLMLVVGTVLVIIDLNLFQSERKANRSQSNLYIGKKYSIQNVKRVVNSLDET